MTVVRKTVIPREYARMIMDKEDLHVQNKEGFTLQELIAVVVIVGILAVLGITQFGGYREKALDKEAAANLKLIRSAERIHRMEMTRYYPTAGSVSNITQINNNLKLDLPGGTTRNWNYGVWSSGCSRATRNGNNNRAFYLTINDTDGEPNSGALCP